MKWHGRYGTTLDLAAILIVAVGIVGLICVTFLIPVASFGASCLTVDIPPQVVVGVMDGDTFAVFNLFPPGYVKIRVQGVNAPERNTLGFKEARQFTADWLAQRPFTIETCGKHTFERIEGVVSRDGKTLAAALIQAGMAKEE
ncbi:MAG: thermonuclease family protein [Nitrospira sp.]|nr:thermonuclease family protein [Nitrospira sp.]